AAGDEAHHVRHISRYACSTLRAKRGASVNGEARIRSRRVERSSARRGGFPASSLAIFTYSPGVSAIKSGSPKLLSTLATMREQWRSPASVTTGTPIHAAWQLIV